MPLEKQIGDAATALSQNQYVDALDGTYWIDGWDATLGAGDLEVDIEPGEGAINTGGVETTETQTVDFAADVDEDDPRKAVVSVDDTGTVQKTLGDPMPADPEGEVRERTFDPAPPTNAPGVVVCEVWIDSDTTEFVNDDIRDRRVANVVGELDSPTLRRQQSVTDLDDENEDVSVDLTTGIISSNGNIQTENVTDSFSPDDNDNFEDRGGDWVGRRWDVKESGFYQFNYIPSVTSSFDGFEEFRVIRNSDDEEIFRDTEYESGSGFDAEDYTSPFLELDSSETYTAESKAVGSIQPYDDGFSGTGDFTDLIEPTINNSASSRVWGYSETNVTHEVNSGEATIEIEDHPVDVFEWDRFTYQKGGGVEVYIESDDGSGWEESAGPIERGSLLSFIDPDSDTRFRVEFTDAEGELRSVYRSWRV